jgi:hypothetical protein
MRDHTTDAMITTAKMKTALPPLAVPFLVSLPLLEQAMQWHIAGGKHTQVAVQGHDPVSLVQGSSHSHGYCFLSNSTEPLTDFSLAQQYQHLFFDHTGQENLPIKMNQFLVAVIVALELHDRYCTTNLQDALLSMAFVSHKKSHRMGGFKYFVAL